MLKKRKSVIIGVVILGLFALAIYVSSLRLTTISKPPVVSKPPVAEDAYKFKVLEAKPTGKYATLDLFFPVSVRFNQGLGTDVSGFIVEVTPKLPIKQYVLSSKPDVLFISPVILKTPEAPKRFGWVDNVVYTVVIKKGSKSVNGSVLNEDYSFSFSNSTKDVSLAAD